MVPVRDQDLERIETKTGILRSRDGDGGARRVEAEVFDRSTLTVVNKLFSDGVLETVEFPISTGKEAVVFTAKTSDTHPGVEDTGWAAVKIYRISNAEFRTLARYIDGDPRFDKVKRDLRNIIYTWSQKEFKNFLRSEAARINVPHVFHVRRNVLVMELITNGDEIAPMMKDAPPEDPHAFYHDLVDQIRTLYRKAKLVHADMSEYNVLVRDERPVIIDMGQAVVLEHPNAMEFLERDVRNVVRVFTKLGVECEEEGLMAEITGKGEEGYPLEPADKHDDPNSRRHRIRKGFRID